MEKNIERENDENIKKTKQKNEENEQDVEQKLL